MIKKYVIHGSFDIKARAIARAYGLPPRDTILIPFDMTESEVRLRLLGYRPEQLVHLYRQDSMEDYQEIAKQVRGGRIDGIG